MRSKTPKTSSVDRCSPEDMSSGLMIHSRISSIIGSSSFSILIDGFLVSCLGILEKCEVTSW